MLALVACPFTLLFLLETTIDMLGITRHHGFNVVQEQLPNLAFISSATDGTNLSTPFQYTCLGRAIGAIAPDRFTIIVVHCNAGADRQIDSCTIGGIVATRVAQSATNTASPVAIFIAETSPLNSITADIVVTFSGSTVRQCISVYRITGLRSATPLSVVETSSAGDPFVSTITNIPKGAFYIAGHTTTVATTALITNATLDATIDLEGTATMFSVSTLFDPSLVIPDTDITFDLVSGGGLERHASALWR
jgi:hypothetical protein